MTRRLIYLLLICLSFTGQAYAQRYLPGQRGIQFTGGLSDNLLFRNGDGFGYHAGIAVATYTKNSNRWVVGAEYLEKRYAYKENLYPVSQFTGEGGYYMKFLSDPGKIVFASLGLSALAGYETVNWGKYLLPDGSTFMDEDNFIYGGALTFEIETFLTDRIVLLFNARERMLFGGDCGRFHTQVAIGVKFIIN